MLEALFLRLESAHIEALKQRMHEWEPDVEVRASMGSLRACLRACVPSACACPSCLPPPILR